MDDYIDNDFNTPRGSTDIALVKGVNKTFSGTFHGVVDGSSKHSRVWESQRNYASNFSASHEPSVIVSHH